LANEPSRRVLVATDPPPDWAVLGGGLRPHFGTFGGIATLAVAQARTERFYGVLSLSLIRNDAGTHVGVVQLAPGRNLSDAFYGGLQLSLAENRARTFVGLGQFALAYDRAGTMIGAFEVAGYNRADDFRGGVQIGGYNRTDRAFVGLAQVGVFDHARGDFTGIAQVGVFSATGEKFLETGFGQHRFGGLAQVGLVSSVDGDFYGLTQLGVFASTSRHFRGLVQIGGVARTGDSLGAQAGLVVDSDAHQGLQVGVLGAHADKIDGIQIGAVNLASRVRGVQIGLVNHTRNLLGVQIGLVNHASDGVLPWTTLLNMGFGDGPAEDDGLDRPEVARAGVPGSF
jgi:hypothetical protein